MERRKDWRKSGWARAADAGLWTASRIHPATQLAYGAVGKLTGFNTEKKCFDFQATATMSAVNGNTSIQSGATVLTNIQQGNNGDECNGNSIRVSDFMFRAQIFWPLSTFQSHRLLLFVDRENTGVTPVIADILEVATSATDVLMSPLNRSNFGRFDILKDEHFTPPINTNEAKVTNIDWTFGEEKLAHKGEHHCTWDDSNVHTAPGALRKGHIWFIWVGVSGGMTNGLNPTITTNTTTSPYIRYWARTRYVDN